MEDFSQDLKELCDKKEEREEKERKEADVRERSSDLSTYCTQNGGCGSGKRATSQ